MREASARAANRLNRHLANPFWILELAVDASAEQVERQGEKLLSMLTLGIADAARYSTPFGPQERTAERVREAIAELRDPNRRLIHEWWAGEEA